MSSSVFVDQPEFIDTDPRNQRPEKIAYRIDSDFMRIRHEVLLPGEALAGKTVLDLGSCNGASGAWALSHGAKSYTGIELQEGYVNQSKENLAQYYSADQWNIEQVSIEEFLSKRSEKFDVIIALGVVHAFADVAGFLNALGARSQYNVIDGTHPRTIDRSAYLSKETKFRFLSAPDYAQFIEKEPFLAMQRTGMSLQSGQTVFYPGYVPSMGFVEHIFQMAAFTSVAGINDRLKQRLPNVYSPRKKYGLCFVKTSGPGSGVMGLTQNVASGASLNTVDWVDK